MRVKGVVPKYNWTLPSIALVAKEEGFAALYKGFLPKVLRLGPGGGTPSIPLNPPIAYHHGKLLLNYSFFRNRYPSRRLYFGD